MENVGGGGGGSSGGKRGGGGPLGGEEELNLTQSELDKLTKAFKKKEFRDLLHEYVNDLTDPKHRQEQEAYLRQLEEAGELPQGCELIRPRAGCCVRTTVVHSNQIEQKLFINICSTERCVMASTRVTHTSAVGAEGPETRE
eukprot:GHVQ01024938.1.p1 GENE.GHVQ01024938.1~~GHVQ01024938.1.p1  ORF type:complete len:142 (-),score=26.75 GHVQ01024938.1:59-484(-)